MSASPPSATPTNPYKPTNLPAHIASEPLHWHPTHITTLNGSASFKTAKILGVFPWHSHPDTDEVFVCVSGGPFEIELCTAANSPADAERRGADQRVELGVGDLFRVPRGMQHRPQATAEAGILMVERVGTLNTGDLGAAAERAVLDESGGA